jgi:hypothetical protein
MRGYPVKKWNVILVTLGVALWVMSVPIPASAIDLGGVTVTPFGGYTGEYDDNLFRVPRGAQMAPGAQKSDYINHMFLGVNVEANPEKKHEVKAGYKYEQLWYSNNNNMDFKGHDAFLSFLLNFNRAQFRFNEHFQRTNEFPTSEITQNIPHNINNLGGGFDFDMAQIWGVGVDYNWESNNYLGDSLNQLDRNRQTFAPNVYYKLSGQTRVFVEYNYAHEIYGTDKNRDNIEHRALVGFRGDLAERFKLTGKFGWQGLYYTAPTYSDVNALVFDIVADYQPVERLGLSASLKRYTEPSVFGSNGHYDYMFMVLAANYNLNRWITVIPRLTFGWSHYPEGVANPWAGNAIEKRDDLDLGAGVGFRWDPVKWAKVELNYDFTSRSSNFSGFEYLDNRVLFTVGGQM